MRVTWVEPETLLMNEFARTRSTDVNLSDLEQRWVVAGGPPEPPAAGSSPELVHLRPLAETLWDEIDARTPTADPVAEPPSIAPIEYDPAGLLERIRGAWVGRAVGCLLGKPVEKVSREGIRQILQSSDRWPLTGYFTEEGVPEAVLTKWPWNRRSRLTSLAENIDGMPEDDDLNFPMLNLAMMETHGRGFTSDDVATAWLDRLPAGRVFTAERVAYRNLLVGLRPPETATHRNPYRDWIGAMIRADLYGWANPGALGAAAEMARRDAVVSHVGDGAYAAMFVAALVSASVVVTDVDEAVTRALEVIPPDCGAAEAVRFAATAVGSDWERTVDAIAGRYGHLHWVHALNNLALTVAALLYGKGDFDRSITAVVMGGWDTDSAGATVGSVVGALVGPDGIDGRWTDPLHNRVNTSLPGFDGIGFDELARRTHALVGTSS